MNIKERYIDFASQVSDICSHVSVRDDNGVPFIFALGIKETHTLQLRWVNGKYVIELWYGENSDVERVIDEPVFDDLDSAFAVAIDWLGKDNN